MKKRIFRVIALVLLMITYQNVLSQTEVFSPSPEVKETVENQPETFAEKEPEYPGGADSLMKFISTNIQYPKSCIEQGISGRVYISFVVEKDGTCTGHKVLRGIAAAPEIDREALRVIRMLTGFQPAMQNGKPVRFQYTIPINFRR